MHRIGWVLAGWVAPSNTAVRGNLRSCVTRRREGRGGVAFGVAGSCRLRADDRGACALSSGAVEIQRPPDTRGRSADWGTQAYHNRPTHPQPLPCQGGEPPRASVWLECRSVLTLSNGGPAFAWIRWRSFAEESLPGRIVGSEGSSLDVVPVGGTFDAWSCRWIGHHPGEGWHRAVGARGPIDMQMSAAPDPVVRIERPIDLVTPADLFRGPPGRERCRFRLRLHRLPHRGPL